ncbi:hypothetical protein BHM03_00044003 [Ensete ventricosum]|nr:hypothetical protein BHM03_00044003 [Ensete ventricosum]
MSSEIHTRRHETKEIPKANHGVPPRSRVVRCTYLVPLSSIHGGALTRPQDRQEEEEEEAGGQRERESSEKAAMTVVPARMGLRWEGEQPAMGFPVVQKSDYSGAGILMPPFPFAWASCRLLPDRLSRLSGLQCVILPQCGRDGASAPRGSRWRDPHVLPSESLTAHPLTSDH